MSILVSVVVPVYNEGLNIEAFLEELRAKLLSPFELLVVYDRDEDDTLPVLKGIIEKVPYWQGVVRLVKNSVQRGPSGALRTGFREARGDKIVVTMADLSDDLSQIQEMIKLSEMGFDIVGPSRYCEGGQQRLHSIKAWIPNFIGKVLHGLTGLETRDWTNSYRFYTRRVLEAFPLVSTHSFSVTLEILAKAHCLGFTIKEIPTEWRTRQAGKSKFPFLSSLGSYLPWFGLALMKNRIVSLPLSWRKRLLKAS